MDAEWARTGVKDFFFRLYLRPWVTFPERDFVLKTSKG
jgi:hypothetical protein